MQSEGGGGGGLVCFGVLELLFHCCFFFFFFFIYSQFHSIFQNCVCIWMSILILLKNTATPFYNLCLTLTQNQFQDNKRSICNGAKKKIKRKHDPITGNIKRKQKESKKKKRKKIKRN